VVAARVQKQDERPARRAIWPHDTLGRRIPDPVKRFAILRIGIWRLVVARDWSGCRIFNPKMGLNGLESPKNSTDVLLGRSRRYTRRWRRRNGWCRSRGRVRLRRRGYSQGKGYNQEATGDCSKTKPICRLTLGGLWGA
jgi:hypothetical protein